MGTSNSELKTSFCELWDLGENQDEGEGDADVSSVDYVEYAQISQLGTLL